MFDDLKTERQSARGAQNRLMAYVGALLVLGAAIAVAAQIASTEGRVDTPTAQEQPAKSPVEADRLPIDKTKLPEGDTAGVHAQYDEEGLSYLLGLAQSDYSPEAVRLPLSDLAAHPFADARGRVFETQGVVEAIDREAWPTDDGRLWSVVLADDTGARAIVLKYGLATDAFEGKPEDAIKTFTDYVEEGDRLLVRGIYLQRRTGTVGEAILRDPVPVLVATPPPSAFRKLPEPAVPIADPSEADWDEVRDRNLRETQDWEEPALYQIIQWARTRGRERVLADIRTGALPVQPWGEDLFERWGAEIEIVDPDVKRPVTESLRGRLFSTPGYIGSFQRDGWNSVPRLGSRWGVDTLYVVDLVGDYWAHQGIRCISVWPREAYEDIRGDREQHVRVTGFFLKNHTYPTRKRAQEGGRAIVTMPLFILVDIEPLPEYVSSYARMIWFVSGGLLLLFVLFYFVFVRGERKEAARMDARRRELRKRQRREALDAARAGSPAETGTPDEDAPTDESGS